MAITSITSNLMNETNGLKKIGKRISKFLATETIPERGRTTTLPSFDSAGRSLVAFSKMKIGSNAQKVMDEIANTKAAIKAIEGSTGTKPSTQVEEAYQKIKNYDWWTSVKDETYKEAVQKADAAQEAEKKSHMWGFRWFTADDSVYGKKMDELYYDSNGKYDLNESEVEKYKAIIDAFEKISSMDENSRIVQLKALKEKLIALEKNLDFSSLQDDVNNIMNNPGGVEERIAGYGNVKDIIQRDFIEPLAMSVKDNNPDIHVPSAVLLYGATGCGKTTFLNAIKEQCKDYAEVVDLSGRLNARSFQKQIMQELADANLRYKNKHKRTIFLINESEQLLCMNPKDRNISNMLLDDADMAMVENYFDEGKTEGTVKDFKTLLDYISKIPTDTDNSGSAATIFMTSNYPHLIHQDILSRRGKTGKLMSIPVDPPADNNLRLVMKYYFKKHSDLLEKIKMYSKKENYRDLINSIPGIGKTGRETLIAKTEDGTIENMHIDPTCSEFPNFDKFIQGNNPSENLGAYSCAEIQNISNQAFVEYLANPTISYERHFSNVKGIGGRDINAVRYKHFLNIHKIVENPQTAKLTITPEEISSINKYKDGIMSPEEEQRFETVKTDIISKYNALKNKENLSDTEQSTLQMYKDFMDYLDIQK